VLLNTDTRAGSGDRALLSVSDLTVIAGERAILDGVECAVHAGERVGVIGPNGAGKSTLLHAVVGLMPISAGCITIAGLRHHTADAKHRIGWVADDLPMPDALTGHELTRLHLRLRGDAFDVDLCDRLLSILGLDDHRHRPCGDYSHGMRRKLSLATALAHRPRLLILDEPFRGLDPVTSSLLRQLIDLHVTEGRAVLMATHDLDQATRLCDRVILVHGGQVVATGAPAALCGQAGVNTLGDAFLELTGQRGLVAEAADRLRTVLQQGNTSIASGSRR
jgi:ABC-2 type transport system ATP-binding protein